MPIDHHQSYTSFAQDELYGADLPAFAVITGVNGAGKTHLLRGLASNALVLTELGPLPPQDVASFLTPLKVFDPQPRPPSAFRDTWSEIHQQIQSHKYSTLERHNLHQQPWPTDAGDFLLNSLRESLNQTALPLSAIARIERWSGRNIGDVSVDDLRLYLPALGVRATLLEDRIEAVFLHYAMRRRLNSYNQWEAERTGRTDASSAFLSDEDWIEVNGREPWVLINETLEAMRLPYSYMEPDVTNEENPYDGMLHGPDGIVLAPSALSGGEQVLLAIAQSLFTAERPVSNTVLPRLLLLDEPDASLHPSMSQQLVSVLNDEFVKKHNIRVVMTTHSATTVAVSPAASLMIMQPDSPRLRLATEADEALAALTVGLPTLAVRVENRRQIFVEAEDDQAIYQSLFTRLRESISAERSLEFIPVGRTRGKEGGVDRVIDIVTKLRTNEVRTVFGLIDRDTRVETMEGFEWMSDRPSLEALVLDPLMLGTYLLREQHLSNVKPEHLGLPRNFGHLDLDGDPRAQQTVIEAVTTQMGLTGSAEPHLYVNGFEFLVPTEYLETGKRLSEIALQVWPHLRSPNGKGRLLTTIIETAARDHPGFLPASLMTTFGALAH